MGTRKRFMLDTHFDLVKKGPVSEFLYKKMVLFVSSFWFSIRIYMFYLARFITRYLFRFQVDDGSQADNSNFLPVVPHEDNQVVSNCFEPEPELEPEVIEFKNSEYEGFDEKETPKFSFKFQFHTSEDTGSSSADSVNPEKDSTINTRKYQFLPGKDFRGVVEEPEVVSFIVKELYADWNEDTLDNKKIFEGGFLSETDFQQLNSEVEAVHEELLNESFSGEDTEKPESVILTEVQLSENDQLVSLGSNSPGKEEISDEVHQFISEKDLLGFDSDPESISFGDRFSIMDHILDSNSEEFLSERDFDEGFEDENLMEFDEEKVESIEDVQNSEETYLENSRILDDPSSSVRNAVEHESKDFDVEIEFIEDIENSDEPHLQNSSTLEPEVVTEGEFCRKKAEQEQEDLGGGAAEPMDGSSNSSKSEEPNLQNSSLLDSEDSNGLETLWEHQDLIEQLKMELRKVKATGLPTILEESESPKMIDDLKPWKIDEKFLHEDRMDELHKFCKSYTERMRKFDILNYQKMYAIGFLQLKDPLQSISSRKSSTPTVASILSQNFRPSKHRRPEADSSTKFMKELQNDLEMVYVGQLCLSWEFLHWQYGKAQELLESDRYETRQYNQVAGEFQQFQVLVQRFMEDEPFHGPRVQNYVKNRCILRNILQVPVIKEDSLKDKSEGRRRRKDGITCSMLIVIIEESMRIFWEFIRADKSEGSNVILKGLLGPQVELHDPADSELLLDVRASLQKKERKLKDILRSGNCIVKRFQKHHEERSYQLVFFSQVDLKLVSRVLKMSRITTDQLVWCHKKLEKITFVDRKIHMEPSFLPFPC